MISGASRLFLCGVLSIGVTFGQSRPTSTEYHTVYESSDGTKLYGQSSLETSSMSIPPGTTIIHTVTASFSLSANGAPKTTFQAVQSGGPQYYYDPVATGNISEIGDAIYLMNLSDTAHCNYFGTFFSDYTPVSYIDPPQINGLQTLTSTGQYIAFAPYVNTPQSPQQNLVINGHNLTADGQSNPPSICVNGACATGAAISTTGFHLGGSWSVTETASTGVSRIAIPYWLDPTATPGNYTLKLTTAGGGTSTSFAVGVLSLNLTYNGSPVTNGGTVYITPSPSLPLSAILSPQPLTGTVAWNLSMTYTSPGIFVYTCATPASTQASSPLAGC